MDRKGWIILILCGIGMMLSFNSWKQGAENSAKLAEQERERKRASSETAVKRRSIVMTTKREDFGNSGSLARATFLRSLSLGALSLPLLPPPPS